MALNSLTDLRRQFVNPNENTHPEVEEFNHKLQAYLKETPSFSDIEVLSVEKGQYDLSYNLSLIVKRVKDIAIYYILVYAATNKAWLTLNEYKELKERGVKNPVLPSNALNQRAGAAIGKMLKDRYGEGVRLDSIDGNIVPATIDLTDDKNVIKYGTLSGNFINARAAKISNGWSEADFGEVLSQAKVIKAYPTTMNAAEKYEIDGIPQFVEYSMPITAIDGDNSEEVNKEGTSVQLGKVLGNVQFIVGVSRNAQIKTHADRKIAKMMKANGKTVAHPVMVINALEDAFITSLGTTFMAIASTAVATAQGRWKEIALANASVPGKNPGELEVIINSLEKEEPARLNLADESLSYEERLDFLEDIVSGSPLLALDITKFMSQTSHFTTLLRASREVYGGTGETRYLKELILGAHEFTNGKFPKDYPVSKIFGRPTSTLPTGFFKDGRRGERSVDEIDTLMILKKFGIKDAIIKMRLDNGIYDKSMNSVDLYLKLMSKVSPDIKITGVKERVYLHAQFAMTLFKAIRQAGIKLEVPAPEDLTTGISMPDITAFDSIGFADDTFGISDTTDFGGFDGFESPGFM